MFNQTLKKRFMWLFLTLTAWIGLVGVCSALTVDLQAGVTTQTMPDGRVVTMWGFGPPAGPVTVPGPEIIVPPGQSLTINLQNNLPVPVSIIIPGQITTMTPVKFTDSTGRQRVRSLTQETAPGGAGIYTWTNLGPGTYLYQSGTHSQVQVQMGLYGIVRKDAAAGQAYTPTATNPNASYDSQVAIVFSEIDPALHDSVVTGNYAGIPPTPGAPVPPTPPTAMTSTIDYDPQYFLINGEPFNYGRSPIPAGTPGQRILLRFLNAGLRDHVPILNGIYMTVLAEDGNLYPYPKQEYSLMLPAGKTADAIIAPTAAGYIPVYDRKLDLTNATASPGGMLAYLTVGATDQLLTVTLAGTGTGKVVATGLPGGIDCGLDCTENYVAGTIISLTAIPDAGVAFGGWTGVDPGTEALNPATVTMNAAKNVTATFGSGGGGDTITVTSPNGGESFARGATVPITWTYTGNPGALVNIQLLQGTTVTNLTRFRHPSIGSGGTGSFNWRIPRFFRSTGNNFRIRITSTTNPAATDTSDNDFSITK